VKNTSASNQNDESNGTFSHEPQYQPSLAPRTTVHSKKSENVEDMPQSYGHTNQSGVIVTDLDSLTARHPIEENANIDDKSSSYIREQKPPLPKKTKPRRAFSFNISKSQPDLRVTPSTPTTGAVGQVLVIPYKMEDESQKSAVMSDNEVFDSSPESPHTSNRMPNLFRQLSNSFKRDHKPLKKRHSSERIPDPRVYSNAYLRTCESHIQVKYVKVYGEEDGAYKNNTLPRGMVFMMNFEDFQSREYAARTGSKKDFEHLKCLFTQMGYKVTKRFCRSGNITEQQFINDLNDFSQQNHSQYDSAIIIIMSHGVHDKTFITYDGKEIDMFTVYEKLNNHHCEVLCGKPKIFILQFCRPYRSQIQKPSSPGASLANVMLDQMRPTLLKLIEQQLQQMAIEHPSQLNMNQMISRSSTLIASSIADSQILHPTTSGTFCLLIKLSSVI